MRDQPCSHPGCQSHHTHPCESCGRQWGKRVNGELREISSWPATPHCVACGARLVAPASFFCSHVCANSYAAYKLLTVSEVTKRLEAQRRRFEKRGNMLRKDAEWA